MTETSVLAITYTPVDELKLYERNARTHSNKQIRQIASSIEAFGFINPVIVDGRHRIIAGHGRVEAAKALGMETVPTIMRDNLTEEQIRQYVIADNRLAEKAGWDKNILAIEFQHLLTLEPDLDITLTGFDLPEIELIVHGLTQDFDDGNLVDVNPSKPSVTQLGDVWVLGEHRVGCGDATKSDEVQALMGGKTADMAFTDPPYNVDYETKDGKHRSIMNDALGDKFEAFLRVACANILQVTKGAIYICMSSSELPALQAAFTQAGGHWSTTIIWAKDSFTLGRSDYQRQYEPILYGWPEGRGHHWCGARNQGDVWFFDKPARNDLHPTMKPVGLVMRSIRNSSPRGGLVLDPFIGSGTTLIAAERTKRICYGMDLDPLYVDATVRRWQRHTGRAAIHGATGKTFDENATEGAHV
ncbi:site-specific DNA-methyltransferase [Paludibacterium sp.]|uniref:site-specific DNA-methyltransferase n=1 Tax=Paludibacterium sp. TaxID=1917523 RepID=UPI0025E0D75E|nr:site-specific DNA-methyltransferase [Paludibacterium sp.]MBV8647858.1 site-specific DNA-methyltransferase [Paludibacterium sp.]